MSRLPTSTPALDAAEQQWWREFGDLEERYCWVQPPAVQRLLRRHYVRTIAALVRPGDRVLELGCGTGWLSLLLAAQGLELTGIDFSPDQIDRARAAAGGAPGVEFRVVDPGELAALPERYDLVVTHAVLHHLATDEVRAMLAQATSLLSPGGRFVAVEPVIRPGGGTQRTPAERALLRLANLPLMLSDRSWRGMGPEERAARLDIRSRDTGEGLLGPSPKETPFVGDELSDLLAEHLPLRLRQPVASLTFRVAEELLLAGLSQPRFWRVARDPLLRIARELDRRMITTSGPSSGHWLFELYVAGGAP